MKKWIHGSIESTKEALDIIFVVNDARLQNASNLPIAASTYDAEDYDNYDLSELAELDRSELQSINTFYALDLLLEGIKNNEIDYKLTSTQKDLLSKFYRNRELAEVNVSRDRINEVLDLVANCDNVIGPQYRPNQPEKNFAKVHGLKMTEDDYKAIIRDIKLSEYISTVKSADKRRLGVYLYEFIHDPENYTLQYSNQIISSDIKIYIKLIPEYSGKYDIGVVSFHDPLD